MAVGGDPKLGDMTTDTRICLALEVRRAYPPCMIAPGVNFITAVGIVYIHYCIVHMLLYMNVYLCVSIPS